MNLLEEVKKKAIEKLELSEEIVDGIIKEQREFIDELRATGLIKETNEEDYQKQIAIKVETTLKKLYMVDSETYEGFVMASGTISDFGATKKYEMVIDKWQKSDESLKQNMIDEGEVTGGGIPLWTEKLIGKQKWKIGKPIEPNKEESRDCVGFFYDVNQSTGLEFKQIRLSGSTIHSVIPLLKKCSVKLSADTKNPRILYSRTITNFKVIDKKEYSYEDVLELIKSKVPKDMIIDMLEGGIDFNSFNNQSTYFFINAVPINCILSQFKSNFIEINNPMDWNERITCYVPKHYKLPAEGVGTIILVGRFQLMDNQVKINAIGIISEYDNTNIEEMKI